MENINITGAQVLSCPPDKSPIFFINVVGEIKDKPNSKGVIYKAEKIVVKGTLEEINKSDQTKRQFLREVFKESSNQSQKIKNFDLSKVYILGVEILRGLGYGIK